MVRAQVQTAEGEPGVDLPDGTESPGQAGGGVRLITLLAAAMVVGFASQLATAQSKKKPSLPYVTIDHPQFIAASETTFLSPRDLLIGVSDGHTAKAYPAAILAQHGVVQDRMSDGPIAVTW